ncbi:MAG: undecaprenyl pyrophosphate synthetase [Actinomycetota bacterium]
MEPRRLHVSCIMDVNCRSARRRGLPRTAGNTAGEESLSDVVRAASKREISHLTVFGFSTENWVRPRAEVRHILGLHKKLFGRVKELNENNVRVNWIGRPFDEPGAKTPLYVQRAIRKAIEDTSSNTGLVLTVAFDYGSRAELTRAAQNLVRTGQELTTQNLASHLYDSSLPPVDVLVRTSGESRISNFMLWQIAGAQIYFTERTWPDFDAVELDAAISLVKN